MKVLQFILSLLIIVDFMEISRADDDGLDLVAMKRPFCNAFTGCGRKRDPAYASAGTGFQLPIPVYRALLRMATARNNGAAEVRMRQRLGPNDLVLEPQEQFALPARAVLY